MLWFILSSIVTGPSRPRWLVPMLFFACIAWIYFQRPSALPEPIFPNGLGVLLALLLPPIWMLVWVVRLLIDETVSRGRK
jgi:hypothetical protein